MTETENAIRKLFADYLDGYNRLDAAALSALHASPCVVVHRNEVLVLNDDNSLDWHKTLLAENDAEGDHVWEMADLQVDQVAPNGAVAKLHWIARRPDGTPLWEDRPTYVVADGGDGWLIWSNVSSNA